MKQAIKDFSKLIGLPVNEAGNVTVDGKQRDLYEMMADLHKLISEYGDTDTEVAEFTVETFQLPKNKITADFGKIIRIFLNGVQFNKEVESPTSEPGSVAELLVRLQTQIMRELDLCNEEYTPNVCAMIHVPGGRKKIVDLICEYVGNKGMSISDAIITIERERSSNLNEIG